MNLLLLLAALPFFVVGCSDVKFIGLKYANLESLDAKGRSGAVLKNLPGNPSNQKSLSIKVENVGRYKYALVSEVNNCSSVKYSTFNEASKPITDELGDDGSKLICVIGATIGFAPQSTPTQYAWIKDTVPPGEFSHSGLTSIMSKSPDQIIWSKSLDADTYSFRIGSNPDCSDSIQNYDAIKAESINIKKLADGQYYACLEAMDLAGNKTTASNSGFKFLVDQTPPSAFYINRPFSISKVLNPELQWSASSSDALFDIDVTSDPACKNIVAQEKGISSNTIKFPINFQDMSDYYICVIARDIANHSTPAANNGYKFTINTSAIAVSFDPNTLPKDPSNVSQLNVDVIGTGITFYRYKIEPLPSTTGAVDSICSDASGYSADVKIDTNISDLLSTDGRKIVCAYGGDGAGNWPVTGAVVSNYNHSEWTRSTAIPLVSFDLLESCGPIKCASRIAISNGKVTLGGSNIAIASISITVQDASTMSLSYLQNTAGSFGAGRQEMAITLGAGNVFAFDMETPSLINGHRYDYRIVAKDVIGNSSAPAIRSIVWDTAVPVFAAPDVTIATREDPTYLAVQPTKVNFLRIKLSANDSSSKIDKYCLGYVSSSSTSMPSDPSASDKCWKNIPIANQSQALSLPNLSLSVPYFPDTYKVFAWVMDFAGNMSARSVFASVAYRPIKPPVLSYVYATYTVSDELPKTSNTMAPTSGSRDVYIRWAVSTRNPRGLKDLKLSYTLDDTTYDDALFAGFRPDARAPSTCKLSAVNSSATMDYAGCIKYTLPTTMINSNFLRFRITAEDGDGAITFGQTNALHLNKFTFLAGNTEAGLGSTALSAIINPRGTQSLAVHSSGQIFILDDRGLLVVDPFDGALKVHPKALSFPNATKIAIDSADDLIVFDGNRIKKLALSSPSPTVTTIIGGGADSSDTVANPLDLTISQSSDQLFFAAPNGDIYFMSESYSNRTATDPLRVRRAVYARNYSIESITISGSFPLFTFRSANQGPTGNYNLENCRLMSAAFTFSSAGVPTAMFPLIGPSSQTYSAATGDCWLNRPIHPFHTHYDYAPFKASIGQNNSLTFNLNSSVSVPPFLADFFGNSTAGIREGSYVRYFQSLSGKLFARVNGAGSGNDYAASYNIVTKAWDRIAGQDNGGECVDGTLATQCAMNLSAIFVDANDRVYMMDNDVVRVIQDDGKILTIAGESRSAGDGKNPLNARFSALTAFDIYPKNSGAPKFVISDAQTMRIREFSENGAIDSVAGNGISDVESVYTTWTSLPAKGQSLSWGNDAPNSGLAVDDSGNILVTKFQGQIPYKINRLTGKWESLTGSSSVPKMFETGHGGYGSQVLGMNSSQVLFGTFNYLHTKYAVGNGRLYQLPTSGTIPSMITPVLSKPDAGDIMNVATQYDFDQNNMLCAAGTSRTNCNGPYASSANLPQAFYDSESQMWMLAGNNWRSSRIIGFKITATPATDGIQDLISFPANRVQSFTIAGSLAANNKRAYVCLNSGSLLKFTMTASGAASVGTPVAFPVPGMKCSYVARSMIYSTARRASEGGTLIFSYELNGLQGVGEMVNP